MQVPIAGYCDGLSRKGQAFAVEQDKLLGSKGDGATFQSDLTRMA